MRKGSASVRRGRVMAGIVAGVLGGAIGACADTEPGAPEPESVVPTPRPEPETPPGPEALVPWQAEAPVEPIAPPPSLPGLGEGAELIVAEGDEVIPQTRVHLDARWTAADDAADPIVGWSWHVDAPDGAVVRFEPSASAESPVLEVNVAGTYALGVDLRRASGATSSAARMLAVVPDHALHVELLWHTPGDSDESDAGITPAGNSVGSDLDLHLAAYPATRTDIGDGSDFWFGEDDCYWLAPSPGWSGPDFDHDPSLDRDDTDGAGPENVNLAVMAEDTCYAVGVHGWDDWNYGPSEATVRVWLEGAVAFEAKTTIVNHDMWLVASICGPDGAITNRATCDAEGCTPTIVPSFLMPLNAGFPF